MHYDFDEEYRKSSAIVFQYLYRLCHDTEIAGELTQETFYKAIKNIHLFRGECELCTWLCQIARFSWYQYYRKHKRRCLSEVSLEDLDPADPHQNIEEDYIQQETLQHYYHKINALPPTDARLLQMRLAGASFRQIAQALSITESNARVRFHRAAKRLKKEGLL